MSEIDTTVKRLLKHIQTRMGPGATAAAGAALQAYEGKVKKVLYGAGTVDGKVSAIDQFREDLARGLRLLIDAREPGDPINGEVVDQVEDRDQVADLGRAKAPPVIHVVSTRPGPDGPLVDHAEEVSNKGWVAPPVPAIPADQVPGELPELPAAGDVGELPELPAADEIPFGHSKEEPKQPHRQRRRKG